MPEKTKPPGTPAPAKKRPGLLARGSAQAFLRGVLAFVGITCALVLIGIVYSYFPWRQADPRAIAAWFLRLSSGQWIALGVGIVVALLMVVFPCAKITGRKRSYEDDVPVRRSPQIVQTLAVLAVLGLYLAGLGCAYHISLALGQSRDWAIIHSLYSWVYVGYSFAGWMSDHRSQPLGRTLREYFRLLGM